MRKLLRNQDGMALVMALIVMLVLSTGAVTAVYYAQSNQGESSAAKSTENAYHAAESGLSAAIAVVQNPNNNTNDATLFGSPPKDTMMCVDPNVAAVNGVCPSGQRTWATYTGTLDTSGTTAVWDLSATGYADNPTGASAAPLHHTVGAQIPLAAATYTSDVSNAWSYLFSTQPKSTGTTCDQTYTTNIGTYVYSLGNLCLSGSGGELTDSNKGNTVESNGYIELTNTTSSYVGASSSAPIGIVKTNQGCIYNGTTSKPCLTGSNHQFIKTSSATTDAITPPTVDWDGWYKDASPGPHANCESENDKSTSHTTWPIFDNDNVRNNSVASVQNLTPNYAYTCWTNNGELAWDPSKNTMTIYGTIFIDGSATIANGAADVYKGYGTIYLSGTFYMGNNTKMCAWVVSSGSCNTFWSLFAYFIISTNGAGPNQGSPALVPTGDGTNLVGSTFQGWLYSTNNIQADANTTIMGPMIGNKLILASSVSKWTSTWNGQGPSGAPGNSPSDSAVGAPQNFTG